jgi:hypothetical protein
VYRRCALAHQWPPSVVDAQEVWEIASALGVATADLEEHQAARRENRPVGAGAGVHSGGRDFVAERVHASRGEAPAPEAPVMNPGLMLALQEGIRGR